MGSALGKPAEILEKHKSKHKRSPRDKANLAKCVEKSLANGTSIQIGEPKITREASIHHQRRNKESIGNLQQANLPKTKQTHKATANPKHAQIGSRDASQGPKCSVQSARKRRNLNREPPFHFIQRPKQGCHNDPTNPNTLCKPTADS